MCRAVRCKFQFQNTMNCENMRFSPDFLFLLTQEEHEHVILYASFQSLLIISTLVPARNLTNPDKDKLYDASFYVDEAWCIQKAWGGGEGHRARSALRLLPHQSREADAGSVTNLKAAQSVLCDV